MYCRVSSQCFPSFFYIIVQRQYLLFVYNNLSQKQCILLYPDHYHNLLKIPQQSQAIKLIKNSPVLKNIEIIYQKTNSNNTRLPIYQKQQQKNMGNTSKQLNESLLQIKDVVIATQQSYIRYNASLQVYYLFVLAKLVYTIVSFVIQVDLVNPVAYCYGEFVWIFNACVIGWSNTPYVKTMLKRILVSHFISICVFLACSYHLFSYTWPETLDHAASIIWVIHIILHIVGIYLGIKLTTSAIAVSNISSELQKQEKYKLKPIKIGTMSMHKRKSSKKQLILTSSNPITPRNRKDSTQSDYSIKKLNSTT